MRALLPYGPDEFQGASEDRRAPSGAGSGARRASRSSTAPWARSAIVSTSPGGSASTRPPRGDDGWHVIEQQAYLRAGERIDALDLLCSGFMPDNQTLTRSRVSTIHAR